MHVDRSCIYVDATGMCVLSERAILPMLLPQQLEFRKPSTLPCTELGNKGMKKATPSFQELTDEVERENVFVHQQKVN